MPDMDEILEEFHNIKEGVQEAKQEKAECMGILSEQMKALRSYGVKSVAGGRKKIKTLRGEIERAETKIRELYEELKEKYEW